MQSEITNALLKVRTMYPYLSLLFQNMSISFSDEVDTFTIQFNGNVWGFLINEKYFSSLSPNIRIGVILHGTYHIIYGHAIKRRNLCGDKIDVVIFNRASDISINQFIPKKYKNKDFIGPEEYNLKELQTLEYYYGKLLKLGIEGTKSGILDSHDWKEGEAEECLLKKSIDWVDLEHKVVSFDTGATDNPVFEFLSEGLKKKTCTNYKKTLLAMLRKEVLGFDREKTWTRPSRRWDSLAQGTRLTKNFELSIYVDTSGSICSNNELSNSLSMMRDMLKIKEGMYTIKLFNDTIYYSQKIKRKAKIAPFIQDGGTDIEPVVRDIFVCKPKMSVVLTDGLYSNVRYERWGFIKIPRVLWLITKEGNEHHPLARLGKTIRNLI